MSDTTLILPLQLFASQGQAAEAAHTALKQLFALCAQKIAVNDKIYSLAVHDSAQSAQEMIGENYRASSRTINIREHQAGLPHSWLAITSDGGTTSPKTLLVETFEFPDFIHALKNRLDALGSAHAVAKLQLAIEATNTPFSIDTLLLDISLHDVLDSIAGNMRRLPCTERIDLSERDHFLKRPFGIDPVVSALDHNSENALIDAVAENNGELMDNAEQTVKIENIEIFNEVKDDFEGIFLSLNTTESEQKERIYEYIQDIINYRGCVDLELSGNCAVDALPQVDGQNMYIQFDGITSSCLNAVKDASYWAMLDLLRIDMRSWVDYLLEREGLPPANWEFDLKGLLDGFQARQKRDHFGYSAGGQHELKEEMLHAVTVQLFDLPANHDTSLTHVLSATNEAPDLTPDQVQQAAINDSFSYALEVALEVLASRANGLDEQWLSEQGIDESKLQLAMTSSENPNLAQYPQLAFSPNYSSWIPSLLPISGVRNHTWVNPPHMKSESPLLTPKALAVVLDNTSYDGSVVIAFDMGLDSLEQVKQAIFSGGEKQITASGAYFHIHSFANGAGDGAELDGDFVLPCNAIKDRQIVLLNDANLKYGIAATFGEFLARDSYSNVGKIPDHTVEHSVESTSERDESPSRLFRP